MRTLLMCSLAVLGLQAQEAPPPDLQDLQSVLDQPIVTASKRIQRLKEAPADATVLTAAELGVMGYRTLGEALDGVLGFRVNNDRAYEGIGVRGLYVLGDQNTRVLFLLNGHPLNSPVEVGSGKAGEDLGVSMDQVERIEIIRGPASSLYGNNAFLGMVNVVLKDPGTTKTGGEGTLTASSRGLAEFNGTLGGPMGRGSWQANVSGMQRRGSGTDYPALNSPHLPADLDREERQSGYLNFKGQDWSAMGYAVSRTQWLSSAPFYSVVGSPLNLYRNRILFGDIRYEPKFGDVETLFRGFGDRNEFSSVMLYDGVRVPGQTGLYQEWDPDRNLGLEAQVRFHPIKDLLITTGVESSWHHYAGLAGIAPDSVETRVKYGITNSYLQADWSLSDAVTLVAGLQAARWDTAQAQNQVHNTVKSMDRQSLSGITPRLAFIWLPTPVDIVKVLYGGGYRNPTIFERYYDDGTSYLANPALKPERIQTLQEIWVRVWDWGLQSQLSYSTSRWTRLIQSGPVTDVLSQFQNEGSPVKGQALEGELKGRWSAMEGYASAGWYRWEQGDASLPNVAEFQASLRLVHRWDAWSASAEVRHLGSRENLSAQASAPASTSLRLGLRWDGDHVWLRGVLKNAGRSRKTDLVAMDYAPITTMDYDARSFQVTAGYRF